MGKKNKKNIITSTKQPHGKGRLMRGVVVERDKYSPSNKKHKPTSKLTSKSKYQLNSLSTSALKALRGDSSSASPHPPPSSETSRLIRNSLGNRTYAQPADRELFSSLSSSYYSKFTSVSSTSPSVSSLNSSFLSAFSSIDSSYDDGWCTDAPDKEIAESLFHPDIVSAGKSESRAWSKTFVSRTLVGEPGTTYKYLGLRIFSHPWRVDDDTTLEMEGRLRSILSSCPTSSLAPPKESDWLSSVPFLHHPLHTTFL